MKLEKELHAELPHEFSLYKNYLLFGDWGSFYFFSHLCIKMFAMIPKIEIITVITSMLFEINSISNTSCGFDKWVLPLLSTAIWRFLQDNLQRGGNYLVEFQ